jgi:CheY-like chemotaxis protein
MLDVLTDDLAEVGRLLGRNGGVLIAHGVWPAERLEHLRQGVAGNTVPPIFLQAPNERTAVQQAMNMLRAKDVLLVLAEDPEATVSLIQRRLRRLSPRNDSTTAKAS